MSMCQLEAIEPIAGDAEDGIQVHFEHEVLSLQGHGAQRDAESERQQLEDRVTQLTRSIAALQGRLNNPGYVQKAPAHLVAESQADLANAESAIEVARHALERL
jgi:valyl-tRNA synthetase